MYPIRSATPRRLPSRILWISLTSCTGSFEKNGKSRNEASINQGWWDLLLRSRTGLRAIFRNRHKDSARCWSCTVYGQFVIFLYNASRTYLTHSDEITLTDAFGIISLKVVHCSNEASAFHFPFALESTRRKHRRKTWNIWNYDGIYRTSDWLSPFAANTRLL